METVTALVIVGFSGGLYYLYKSKGGFGDLFNKKSYDELLEEKKKLKREIKEEKLRNDVKLLREKKKSLKKENDVFGGWF